MGKKEVKKHTRYILFVAGLIFILRIPSLYQHIMDIDETAFSEFASIMLNGGIPYIDAVDNKPPLTYYFFYMIYALIGKVSLLSVHLVTSVWVALTGVVIYFTGAKLRDENAGFAAALSFALMMHTYEPKYISANGETLINLFLAVSSFIFLFVRGRGGRNIFLHFISGLMLGLAVMTNYKAGILAVVFILHSLIAEPLISRNRRDAFREGFIRLFITGISSFIPVAAFLIVFKMQGNFSEALFWGFLYNFGYIESGKGAFSSFKIVGRMAYFVFLTLPVWIVAFKYVVRKIHDWRAGEGYNEEEYSQLAFIILWSGFSLYAALLGGRGYGHYFIQLVPPLSLAVAAGYDQITGFRKTFWIWLAIPAVIFTVSRINILKTYELVNYPNYRSEISFRKTGEYIKNVSNPGDRIYAWGWSTPIYYFADRRSASRFMISDFVSGRIFGTANRSGAVRSEMTDRFMPILMDDLKKNRPLYFIDTSPSGYFGYDRFPLSSYKELQNFVDENYSEDRVIDGMVIYKRSPR